MRIFASLLFIFLCAPFSASAATLYLSPSTGTYTAGKAFTVSVYVASSDQSLNAVSGTITVPSTLFSIVSASSVGSVVNFWASAPSVSGSSVAFEGVVLNPGYQGSGAKVASFVLMPKSSGTGVLSFSSASVLANDGQGTDILQNASGATFSVREAPAAELEPAPEVAPPAPTEDALEPPRIIEYDRVIDFGDFAKLRGITYENALVEVLIRKNGSLIATERVDSNSLGDFSMVITKQLDPGSYEATARVSIEGARASAETEPVTLKVQGGILPSFDWFTSEHLAIIAVIALALIAALAVLHAYGWRHLFTFINEARASQIETSDITRRVFAILKKDIATHVRKMREAKETRTLTAEEIAFLEDFEEELNQAETALKAKSKRRTRKITPTAK